MFLVASCAPEPRAAGFIVAGTGGSGGSGGEAPEAPSDGPAPSSGKRDAGVVMRTDAPATIPDTAAPAPDAAPPGPVAPSSQSGLFSGQEAMPAVMVWRDPSSGYFYVGSPSATQPQLSVVQLEAEARAGLPADALWAQQVNTGGELRVQTILGWNFRANDGEAWRWVDASAHTGLAFWVKTTLPNLTLTVLGVDRSAIPMNDARKGTCPGASRDMCPGLPRAPVTATQTWTEVKLPWSAFTQSEGDSPHPLQPQHLGRIDLLFVTPPMSPTQVWVTGVRFLSAAAP